VEIEQVLNLVKEIIDMVKDVDEVSREADEDYFASVLEKAQGIGNTIRRSNTVTERQRGALKKMMLQLQRKLDTN